MSFLSSASTTTSSVGVCSLLGLSLGLMMPIVVGSLLIGLPLGFGLNYVTNKKVVENSIIGKKKKELELEFDDWWEKLWLNVRYRNPMANNMKGVDDDEHFERYLNLIGLKAEDDKELFIFKHLGEFKNIVQLNIQTKLSEVENIQFKGFSSKTPQDQLDLIYDYKNSESTLSIKEKQKKRYVDKHFKSLYKTTDLKDEVRKKTFAFSSIWVCALIGVGISISLGAMTIGFPIIPVLAASAIVFLFMGVYIGYRKSLGSIECPKKRGVSSFFLNETSNAENVLQATLYPGSGDNEANIPIASKVDSSYRQAKNCQPLPATDHQEEAREYTDTREAYHQHANLTCI